MRAHAGFMSALVGCFEAGCLELAVYWITITVKAIAAIRIFRHPQPLYWRMPVRAQWLLSGLLPFTG